MTRRGSPTQRGATKARQSGRIPLPDDIAEVIETLCPPAVRLETEEDVDVMLKNPRTGGRWSHWALRQGWLNACKTAGVRVGFYEGTKHSGATALLERTNNLDLVRQVLRHSDIRSTEKYARMKSSALVEVLRPKKNEGGGG